MATNNKKLTDNKQAEMNADEKITPVKKKQPGDQEINEGESYEGREPQDESYITLPDVEDIPGQENIKSIGSLGEMSDTTISSDDEEGIRDGRDILQEEDEESAVKQTGSDADVTGEDLAMLGPRDQDMDGGDDETVLKEGLDDTDMEGEPLNEAASDMDSTGDDLDIPDADEDDPRKGAMGQGDEENNYYSLGSDDNDNLNEGTP